MDLPIENFEILKTRSKTVMTSPHINMPQNSTFNIQTFISCIYFLSNLAPFSSLDSFSHTELTQIAIHLSSDYLLNHILHNLMTPNSAPHILKVLISHFGIENFHVHHIFLFFELNLHLDREYILHFLNLPSRGMNKLRHIIKQRIRQKDHFWSFHANSDVPCAICNDLIPNQSSFYGKYAICRHTVCCFRLAHITCWNEAIKEKPYFACPKCGSIITDNKIDPDSDLMAVMAATQYRQSQKIATDAIYPKVTRTSIY